jgi:uncharacterized damage-inducible protein DinB
VRLTEYRELYAFNRWANHRVLDMVSALSDEELRRDLRNSFPSIRDTLAHNLSAEWIWMERLKGHSPVGMPDEFKAYGLAEIASRWRTLEAEQETHLAHLTEADLARMIAYRNIRGEPKAFAQWQILRHVVNHATYHRGQITGMLRQLGKVPLATDMIVFFDEPRST